MTAAQSLARRPHASRTRRSVGSLRRYAALVAAALALYGAHAEASSSSSGSGDSASASRVTFDALPQNASTVARVSIALSANESAFNVSEAVAAALADNETITFESLLLTPENMLLPHLKQLTAANATHETNGSSIAVDAMGAERVPATEAASDPHRAANSTADDRQTTATNVSTTQPPLDSSSNTTAATENNTTDQGASSASPSLDGELPVGEANVAESAAPEIEIHGVPSPPTLVTAAASDGSAEVSWQVPDDDGSDPILEYEIAWIDEFEGKVAGTKVVTQTPRNFVASSQTPPNSEPNQNDLAPTTATISSLVNGHSYAFKVRAKNANGYSTWSAKSLVVSPLHPPDLCGRVACSGHGTCFPMYQAAIQNDRRVLSEASSSSNARCLCRPGFNPPDCSVKNEETAFVWKVTEWGECGSGCGGGQRSRSAICWDVALDKQAESVALCPEKKPSLTRICNGMECGSKLVSVRYQVETSFDEVLFSPEAWDAFEVAFTTEVAAALQIPRTRLEVTAIRRGSIVVFFQILPASRVGEPSLNDIVERLQFELGNATSTLRSQGTFARRVETTGVKLSFSIADQTVAGGAEDISIAGLIGTVFVLCLFVALFGLFLRKRHERISRGLTSADAAAQGRHVLNAKRSEMKPMGIRTMA